MKRRITVLFICLLGVVTALVFALHSLDTQSHIAPAHNEDIIASFPVVSTSPLRVEVSDGLIFKLDTGSDISSISPDDLEKLRSLGVSITEKPLPVIGRNTVGDLMISSKRYLIDLPLSFVTIYTDSTGSNLIREHIPQSDNLLVGAEFVLTEDNGSPSAIGIDILQKFYVEYLYDNQIIRLHTKRPDGYQDFSNFHASIWPSHFIWPGKRYYLDMEVDNVTDAYFIDTGLRNVSVKLPMSRSGMSRRRLSDDSLVSHLGSFPAKSDNVWVEVGNRAGSQKALYSDNEEEPYSLNPMNVFTQDLLIDFPRKTMALRPYVLLPRHHFNNPAAAAADTTVNPVDKSDTKVDSAMKAEAAKIY